MHAHPDANGRVGAYTTHSVEGLFGHVDPPWRVVSIFACHDHEDCTLTTVKYIDPWKLRVLVLIASILGFVGGVVLGKIF